MEDGNRICPIVNREISIGDCYDVHMVIEDGAPKWSAPEDIMAVPNFKEQCLKCKYHRND